MSSRATPRPWSHEEDTLLKFGVAKYGWNTEQWKSIAAEFVPARSNKACRKRWLHSLSPTVKKTQWTPEEDQLLVNLYQIHGTRWAVIARAIPGRTDDACSKRYREALDPSLVKSDWTSEEDALLGRLYQKWEGKWTKIGFEMSSSLACRNRWRWMSRRTTTRSKSPNQNPGDAVHDPSFNHPVNVDDQFQWSNAQHAEIIPPWTYNGNIPGTNMQFTNTPEEFLPLSSETLNSTPLVLPPFHSSTLANALSLEPQTNEVPIAMQDENVFLPLGNDAVSNDFAHFPSVLDPESRSVSPLEDCGSIPSPGGDDTMGNQVDGAEYVYPGADSSQGGDHLDRAESTSEAEPRRASPPPQTIGKKRRIPESELRLSSTRMVDFSIRPYACGHPSCWPDNAQVGSTCFSTSKDLSDHDRSVHVPHRTGRETPSFRCALSNCGKSWKSINGLQYHLQVSKSHFCDAISKTVSDKGNATTRPAESGAGSEAQKLHACHRPDCNKVYRQISGLRYHIKHGHPEQRPAQLSCLPDPIMAKLNA